LQRAGRVSDSLGVVAARIGDDAAGAFCVGERRDLVVRAAQLEGTDGLKVFGLQVESPAFVFQLD